MALSLKDPEQKEMIDFLAQVLGYYKQEDARNFLAYARLLRPLSFTTPAEMPQLGYTAVLVKEKAYFPALMSGVFLAEDADVGIFLANASTQEEEYVATFDPSRHGLDVGKARKLTQITPQGEVTKVQEQMTGAVTLRGKLAARSITMYRLELE
jgi:hypothetical protein